MLFGEIEGTFSSFKHNPEIHTLDWPSAHVVWGGTDENDATGLRSIDS